MASLSQSSKPRIMCEHQIVVGEGQDRGLLFVARFYSLAFASDAASNGHPLVPKLMTCFEIVGKDAHANIALSVKRLKIEHALVSWQHIARLSDSSIVSFTGPTVSCQKWANS